MDHSHPSAPRIGVVMGSQSDWETMRHAAQVLDELGIAHEVRIVSAHRTPERLRDYAAGAEGRGPGMLAAQTAVPVLGVPVQSRALNGLDSLLSIVQMPAGVPVGTLAIGPAGATNAALLAAAFLAGEDPEVRRALAEFRRRQTASVAEEPQR
jgi:5-(carboxyamino)imidazole ribonucleotide mutase